MDITYLDEEGPHSRSHLRQRSMMVESWLEASSNVEELPSSFVKPLSPNSYQLRIRKRKSAKQTIPTEERMRIPQDSIKMDQLKSDINRIINLLT